MFLRHSEHGGRSAAQRASESSRHLDLQEFFRRAPADFPVNIAFFLVGLTVGAILLLSDVAWWISDAWFAFPGLVAVDAVFFPSWWSKRRSLGCASVLTPDATARLRHVVAVDRPRELPGRARAKKSDGRQPTTPPRRFLICAQLANTAFHSVVVALRRSCPVATFGPRLWKPCPRRPAPTSLGMPKL